MNLKFWQKKPVPVPAPPPQPVMTELEGFILEDFTKHPETWSLRRIRNATENGTRADSMGVTIITRVIGFAAPEVKANCSTHLFTDAFANQWHAIAASRLTESEQKEKKHIADVILVDLENRWGATARKVRRVPNPRE